jgi:hypothetical protein
MAHLLFKLRNVPDDEADDVRRLLAQSDIDYYETSSGRWGLGMPGLWAADRAHFEKGRALIDRYEQRRREHHVQLHERLKAEGKSATLWGAVRDDPLRFVLYATIIAVVAYFSIKPFLDFGK